MMKLNALTLNTQYPLPTWLDLFVSPKKQDQLRSRLAFYWQQYRTRRQLARLTDEQLDDIGMTREEAQHEALQPFWR